MSFKVVRDANGELLAFGPDADSYEPSVPAGATIAVEQEQPQPDPAQQVKSQIEILEFATKMNRAAREGLLLLTEKETMREYSVDQATAQAGLYAGNLGYRKVKDVDNQIAALRAQIGEL